MPIYEIDCSDCETRFEKLLSRSVSKDLVSHNVTCKYCGSSDIRLIVGSSFGFSFKGGSPSVQSADMLVGRKADEAREIIAERKKKKRAVQVSSKENMVLRDADGGYVAANAETKELVRGTYNSTKQFTQKLGKDASGKDLDKSIKSYKESKKRPKLQGKT